MATKFCTQCGKAMDSAASFCPLCGTRMGTPAGETGPSGMPPVMRADGPASAPAANPNHSYGAGAANTNQMALIRKIAILSAFLGVVICFMFPWYGVKLRYKEDFLNAYEKASKMIQRGAIEDELDYYGVSYRSLDSDMSFLMRSLRDCGLNPVEEAADFAVFGKMYRKLRRVSASNRSEIGAAAGTFTFAAVFWWIALAAALGLLALAVLSVLKNKRRGVLPFTIVIFAMFIVHILLALIAGSSVFSFITTLGKRSAAAEEIFAMLTIKPAAFLAIVFNAAALIMNFAWKTPGAQPVRAGAVYPGAPGSPYNPVSYPANPAPYNPAEPTVNPYAPAGAPYPGNVPGTNAAAPGGRNSAYEEASPKPAGNMSQAGDL